MPTPPTTTEKTNRNGFKWSDYQGLPSTLCKGCGHDNITRNIIQAYFELGVDQMPNMEFPVVTVTAQLEGASPETMEEDVTEVLEEHINTIAGLRSLKSLTMQSAAMITAEFELATTYIILRVINGDYGLAIAYSCALIVLMLAVILLIQLAVGERRLGRRAPPIPKGVQGGSA